MQLGVRGEIKGNGDCSPTCFKDRISNIKVIQEKKTRGKSGIKALALKMVLIKEDMCRINQIKLSTNLIHHSSLSHSHIFDIKALMIHPLMNQLDFGEQRLEIKVTGDSYTNLR